MGLIENITGAAAERRRCTVSSRLLAVLQRDPTVTGGPPDMHEQTSSLGGMYAGLLGGNGALMPLRWSGLGRLLGRSARTGTAQMSSVGSRFASEYHPSWPPDLLRRHWTLTASVPPRHVS